MWNGQKANGLGSSIGILKINNYVESSKTNISRRTSGVSFQICLSHEIFKHKYFLEKCNIGWRRLGKLMHQKCWKPNILAFGASRMVIITQIITLQFLKLSE